MRRGLGSMRVPKGGWPGRSGRMKCLGGLAAVAGAALAAPALADDSPQRSALESAVGAPDWLRLRLEARARYETLDGQFRANGRGGDQALAFRTLLLAEAQLDAMGVPGAAIGIELQDARKELDDSGTPLSTSNVNALDVLQAYARFALPKPAGIREASLTLGRQTMDIGSRRVLERVEMANVIFSYTGAYARAVTSRGDEWHVLRVSPVNRRPNDRDGLEDNTIEADREEWGRRFYGLHYRRAKAFGAAMPDVWAEAFVYRLIERDTTDIQTPNRDYVQPGVRLFRAPKAGRLDFDVEASWRTGSRRETSAASDTRDLKVRAATFHAHAGWTFEHDWKWRVAVDLDWASGDKNPRDGRFDRFERLFGGRRTDLGNTGIHGPLTPANILAPGGRVEFAPDAQTDVRLAWKAAWLDSATDAWIVANVRDPSGQSGRFIGHTLDLRVRRWVKRDTLRAEFGASALWHGRFARQAPNAPEADRTLFGYVSLTATL